MKKPHFIHANQVTIEVIDENTGEVFRRQIPLEYSENHNGLILKGEDFHGNPSEIVFISEKAVHQIKDLVGQGPNASPCEGH